MGGIRRVCYENCVSIRMSFSGVGLRKLGEKDRKEREHICVKVIIVSKLPRGCH